MTEVFLSNVSASDLVDVTARLNAEDHFDRAAEEAIALLANYWHDQIHGIGMSPTQLRDELLRVRKVTERITGWAEKLAAKLHTLTTMLDSCESCAGIFADPNSNDYLPPDETLVERSAHNPKRCVSCDCVSVDEWVQQRREIERLRLALQKFAAKRSGALEHIPKYIRPEDARNAAHVLGNPGYELR